jgi:hypothetical protein
MKVMARESAALAYKKMHLLTWEHSIFEEISY